jgi:hypothetical protein
MNKSTSPLLMTADDYAHALRRAAELRKRGEEARSNPELAALEGAIALYASRPGEPDERKAKPVSRGEGP